MTLKFILIALGWFTKTDEAVTWSEFIDVEGCIDWIFKTINKNAMAKAMATTFLAKDDILFQINIISYHI